MARYSSKDIDIKIGGQSIKGHVQDDITIGVEIGTEESTSYGSEYEEHISNGIKRMDPITVGGFYDDTASTGPDAKFNQLGETITFKIDWGGTKSTSVDTIVKRYERLGKVGDMTRYVATLLPTGAITEQ